MDQGLGQDRDAPEMGRNLSVFMCAAGHSQWAGNRLPDILEIIVDKQDFHDIIDKVHDIIDKV